MTNYNYTINNQDVTVTQNGTTLIINNITENDIRELTADVIGEEQSDVDVNNCIDEALYAMIEEYDDIDEFIDDLNRELEYAVERDWENNAAIYYNDMIKEMDTSEDGDTYDYIAESIKYWGCPDNATGCDLIQYAYNYYRCEHVSMPSITFDNILL